MSILTEWDYHLDVDGVLKGQNADPAVIRKRSPRLVSIAERALEEAHQIIKPVAVIEILDVLSLTHDRLELSGGHYIQGKFVPQHLLKAKQVAVAACTISAGLSKRVSEIGNKDICYALALVGVGHVLDTHVVGTGSALRSAVICFYLSNEGVSLLENASHLGLPVPEKLKAVLSQLHDKHEKEGPNTEKSN